MCVLTSPILYCPTQKALGELLVFGMVLNASLSIILFFTQATIWFFSSNSSRGAFPQFLPSPPSPAGQGASNFLGPRRPFLQLLVANTSQGNPFPETALTRELPGARRVCTNDGEMQPHGGATQGPSHSRVPLKDQQPRGQPRPRLWLRLVQLLFLLNPTLFTPVRCSS